MPVDKKLMGPQSWREYPTFWIERVKLWWKIRSTKGDRRMRDARYDDAAELDEVVADDVASFHLERMNNGAWWIGLEHEDGTTTHINLYARAPDKTIVSGRCEFDM